MDIRDKGLPLVMFAVPTALLTIWFAWLSQGTPPSLGPPVIAPAARTATVAPAIPDNIASPADTVGLPSSDSGSYDGPPVPRPSSAGDALTPPAPLRPQVPPAAGAPDP